MSTQKRSTRTHKQSDSATIIVASDVQCGHTVFWHESEGWSADVYQATCYEDSQLAEQVSERIENEQQVIDIYLVGTDLTGYPKHIRESIRASGPTVESGLPGLSGQRALAIQQAKKPQTLPLDTSQNVFANALSERQPSSRT